MVFDLNNMLFKMDEVGIDIYGVISDKGNCEDVVVCVVGVFSDEIRVLEIFYI